MRQLEDKKNNVFRFFSEMIKFRLGNHVFTRETFIGKVKVSSSIMSLSVFRGQGFPIIISGGTLLDVEYIYPFGEYICRMSRVSE